MKLILRRLHFLFAAILIFLPNGVLAENHVKVTVDAKTRQALVSQNQIDGQEDRALLIFAQNIWHNVHFDKNALQSVQQASEKYFYEFDSMKLKKGKKETSKKYGTIDSFVEWGSDKTALDRFSQTKADIGYVFVKAAPYFSITIHSAQNKNNAVKGSAYKKMDELRLLFTKAQLSDFIKQTQ